MIHMDTSTPVGAAQIHELVGQEELCDGLHELRADACHAHARAHTHTHAQTHVCVCVAVCVCVCVCVSTQK